MTTEIELIDQQLTVLRKRREQLEYAAYYHALREQLAPLLHEALTTMEDDAAFAGRIDRILRAKGEIEADCHPRYRRDRQGLQQGLQGVQGMNPMNLAYYGQQCRDPLLGY